MTEFWTILVTRTSTSVEQQWSFGTFSLHTLNGQIPLWSVTPRLKPFSKFHSFELLFCVSHISDDINNNRLVKGEELRINKCTLSDFNLSLTSFLTWLLPVFLFQHYNSHLESSSVGSPDTGAVYRALPVYRVSTEACLVKCVIVCNHGPKSKRSDYSASFLRKLKH